MLLSKYPYMFFNGLKITLLLAVIAVAGGAVIGSIMCLLRMSSFSPMKWLAGLYIEVIRGTPLLLQLYFFYFLLPKLIGVDISKFTSISIALIINSSAYVAEIVRSGIQAVDKGQTEAARSLGLSKSTTMIKIIMPQAIKNILPALGNEFVMVIKETSLASTFYVGDLMTQHKALSGALYMTIEPLIIVGVIYFVLTYTLSKVISAFERRMAVSD